MRAACALATGLRIALAALVALPGCGTLSDPPPLRTYLIQFDAADAAPAAARKPAEPVYVAPVSVAAPFSERNLVVRESELGFQADPYAEFAANPVSMWTDAVRTWLGERGLFERVLPLGSSAEAALTLETTLLEAVVDRRGGLAPASRVTMRFLLVRNRAPYDVLLDRTFTRAEAVQGPGAESEVAAMSRAARAVLRDFEDALARMPGPPQ
jgi:ABC-type uncharacterized transport system auxiliary subunit